MARRRRRSIAATMMLSMLAAGCTGGAGSTPTYSPTYRPTDCPAEIRTATSHLTKCGYLTVPEDRSQPEGRQIRLFVFRIEREGSTAAVPIVYVGDDLGSSFDYAATAGMADHLDGPEVIALEMRGTGYSEPNLSCPEVEAISPQTLTAPIDDPSLRQAFAAAVQACHDRLTGQGIDLSAYDVEEAAADVIDLVHVLGLERWDVISKGSTSRVVFAAMQTQPIGLNAVVLYNPEFPDTDPFVQAFHSTRASIDHLDSLCRADPGCAQAFPDVAGSVDEAIRRFDRHPVDARIAGARVFVDGARLLRGIRNLFAAVRPDNKTYLHLPATLDALAHAKDPASSLAAVVSPEIAAPTFCVGFSPTCTTVLSVGAYYSVLCRDVVPFANLDALPGLAAGDAPWMTDYVTGPYEDLCRAWDVPPASRSVVTTVASDVPVLVYSGELDPFVASDVVGEGLTGLPNAFVIHGAVQSHPVLIPPACADDNSRNEFLAEPTSKPSAMCLEHFQPTFARSPL